MSLTISSLLAHDERVPPAARDALKAAPSASPERRAELLESAARILHQEAGVDCSDARELVDLYPEDCAE
jgi:hypothetical protein